MIMALYLKTKNNSDLITKNIINRTNIFQKGTGLMFHKKILNEAHIFYFKHAQVLKLTMFFVFFPIDVIFINNGKIVDLKENFKPFTNYTPKAKADIFIELPAGFIKKFGLGLNKEILIE